MKNNKLTLFLLSAVLATACTNHQSKPKKIAEVEYAQPVHVSSNVKSQRVYSSSSSTNQAGVVRPYSEVVSSSGGNVTFKGDSHLGQLILTSLLSFRFFTVSGVPHLGHFTFLICMLLPLNDCHIVVELTPHNGMLFVARGIYHTLMHKVIEFSGCNISVSIRICTAS